MGWEAPEQWGQDVARIEPIAGGVANQVWSVRANGQLAVGRLGARSDADLAWETDLLRHLDSQGLVVPVPIATRAGRLFAVGLVVMTYMDGGPPEMEADWRRVAGVLRRLHRLTRAGRSGRAGVLRPTCLAKRSGRRSTWVRCRQRELPDAERPGRASPGVSHASSTENPSNSSNIRMTADQVAMIDWDESHVDVPDLDLVLPHNAADLGDDAYYVAAQASAAWEAAVCWDDAHAVEQLARVREV